MIEPAIFTVEALLHAFLDDHHGNEDAWRQYASIERVEQSFSGCHSPGEPRAKHSGWVVRYGKSFLRYSCGPSGSVWWDCYGDDFLSPALAFRRLLDAPVPPSICQPWPPNPDAPAPKGGAGT